MRNIKDTMKKKMREHDFSTSELSQTSGEKFTFIKSILNGRAQNPGAFAMLSLAKSLNCSIEELLTGNPSGTIITNKDYPIENYRLFLDSANKLAQLVQKNNLELAQNKFFKATNEVYEYAIRKKWVKIDPDFVDWYFENNLGI